jgi:uncharacterized protein
VHGEAITQFASAAGHASDAAHDDSHLHRVVASAYSLARAAHATLDIVLPAAWLHDCVHVPKTSPDRARASVLAADQATAFLRDRGYPSAQCDAIHHAIAAHSFSAKIPPTTVEAQVVQDADRLDAIGAIGIARCLMLGGQMGRPLYHPDDPFADDRAVDDGTFSIDHFYAKLLTLAGTMQTVAGRAEADRRTAFLRAYLAQLRSEIESSDIPR